MGDEDEGDPQLLLDALELHLHVLPQPQVQGPQGFVQEQDLGPVHQGPGDGDALLLAAGEAVHLPLLEAAHAHHLQHFAHPPGDLVLSQLGDAQAEGDVVVHIQVGEEGVALEDGVDLPFVGRDIINPHPVEQHSTGCGLHEASDDLEGRGFAAAAGSEQREEFGIVDIEVYVV